MPATAARKPLKPVAQVVMTCFRPPYEILDPLATPAPGNAHSVTVSQDAHLLTPPNTFEAISAWMLDNGISVISYEPLDARRRYRVILGTRQ